MKPGPKLLPRNARRVERVVLNLYPAEYESLAMVAFDLGVKPKDVARWALVRGLKVMIDEVEADDFVSNLLIKSRLNQ